MTSAETHTPPDAGGGRPAGPTFEVNIEGTIYDWPEPTITVAEIRRLGGLPADQQVIEIDFQNNTELTLSDDVTVELKPGHGFGKKIGFKRGDQ